MMHNIRGRKILSLCQNEPLVLLPKWESTRGTNCEEQKVAIDFFEKRIYGIIKFPQTHQHGAGALHSFENFEKTTYQTVQNNPRLQKKSAAEKNWTDSPSEPFNPDHSDYILSCQSSSEPLITTSEFIPMPMSKLIIHHNKIKKGSEFAEISSSPMINNAELDQQQVDEVPGLSKNNIFHTTVPTNLEFQEDYNSVIANSWTDTPSEPFSSDHSEYLPSSTSSTESSAASLYNQKYLPSPTNSTVSLASSIEILPVAKITIKKLELEERLSLAQRKILKKEEKNTLKIDPSIIPKNQPANNKKSKRIRSSDFCYFCETDVLNFSRHIKRNHMSETEVAKIFSLAPKNKERQYLISELRKKGNFVNNSQGCSKPVRKLKDHSSGKFSPCKYCLGFYSSKQLWRHVKICKSKSSDTATSFSHLTDGQNILLQGMTVDKQLSEIVFPRMMPDKISLTAKKDVLICMFGARYLKCHREKHFINVCSRKMRELSRLLIAMMDAQPTIKSLLECLQPQNFDLIVQCVKIVSKFDVRKDNYKSPTYAMNIHTSLKQCCDIAILNILKRKSVLYTKTAAEAEADMKTMKQLLQDSWCFEVSTKAAADLNTKKWNKISIIPLASDLRIFKTYLEQISNQAYSELEQDSKNCKAYQTLLETVFCRLLLLNRKRIGELQRLPLQIYIENDTTQNYEEFSEAVTPVEKILLKKFKRIVIRGKRGRGVPVLFSSELQKHTNKLVELREHFINVDNPYLFANIKTSTSITGYKILNKYASSSNAKNPSALTSTRLRKHLATISQLFSMSGNEIEQLATFMGHTSDVHKQVYRLPDDVYQTAKISKLLLLMEKGQAAQYKGKTLDEIDIDLDIDIKDLPADDDKNDYENPVLEFDKPGPSSKPDSDIRPKKLKRTVVPWTKEQKEKTKKFFAAHIKNKKPPKRLEVIELKSQTDKLLDNKTWEQVKVFIQNTYTKT